MVIRRLGAMDRIQKAAQNMEKLFGKGSAPLAKTDPEFAAIRDRLMYGQIASRGTLGDSLRMLVTLVSLTAGQNLDGFKEQVKAAMRTGLTPVEIREALYHCAPYAGLPRAESAVRLADQVFRAEGIALPLPDAATVTEETRFQDGLAAQKAIFGDAIDEMHKNCKAGQEDIMVDYLSAYCFGDFYTRRHLDLKTRELLTFSIIATLGGCEPQLKAHVGGCAHMGLSKQNLVDAVACLVPLIGFPRSLNALGCVNAVLAD